MKSWRDKYEHHLLLKMARRHRRSAGLADGVLPRMPRAISLPARRKKAAKRFFIASPPRAAIRYQAVHAPTKWKIFWRWISPCAVTIPSGLSSCRG
jgi:D-lactate dehydrogenase